MSMNREESSHEQLVAIAKEASLRSYSPYSRFRVGAAVLCADGSVYRGTNIENRSFGLTSCAERSAVFSAVSDGKRKLAAVAVYSPDASYPVPPCGACRQVLSEFGDPGMVVIMACEGRRLEKTLAEIFPLDSLHELREDEPRH